MIEVDGRPVTPAWNYTQAEKIADGFVHVIGLALAVCGGATLVVLASRSANWTTIATVGVYATSLVVALAFSAAYNMLPASGTKCLLRRFDQAAIFLLDWRNLHRILDAGSERSRIAVCARGGVCRCDYRRTPQAGSARSLGPTFNCCLSHSRLEWSRAFSDRPQGLADYGSVPHRVGRLTLHGRCHFSHVETAPFSERNLACLRAARCQLSLWGSSRLLSFCANISFVGVTCEIERPNDGRLAASLRRSKSPRRE